MGTIGTTALLGRLVDLDVLHDQVAGVEAFGIGVRFRVLEQAEEEFGGFLGPAGAGDAELFACIYCSSLASSISLLLINGISPMIAKAWPSSRAVFNATVAQTQHFFSYPRSYRAQGFDIIIPCEARPTPPAYRLIGTTSFFSITLSR